MTSGPHSDSAKSINIGVAAHITGASPGGARYDESLTVEQRTSPGNGIWLCQKCAKLIDTDEQRYTVDVLNQWKNDAEIAAIEEIERRPSKGDVLTGLLSADGIVVGDTKLVPRWPEHWKGKSICIVPLYAHGTEPSQASLDELIDRAKLKSDSDLVRGFTVIRDLLHVLSDFDRPAPPLIPTKGFPSDLRQCHELCHEIFMCSIVLLRAVGMPYGHIYDLSERERIGRLLTRLWIRLAQVQPLLESCGTLLLKASDKSTAGVSAHKTIAVIGEYLIREVVAISEFNWNVVNQLREWQEGDSLPFAPPRVAERWQDVYRKLHASKDIDAAFDESRKAFWQLAPEAARAADISQNLWADEAELGGPGPGAAPDRGGA